MPTISAIVEGHAETASVPILLRRIANEIDPNMYLDIPAPVRVSRQKVVKSNELERVVESAARRSGRMGRILILLDADDDCPATLGLELLRRAEAVRQDRRIRVVLAKAEFETWFLASAKSIAGYRGIDTAAIPPHDPESIRDAKRWLTNQMQGNRAYHPRSDQPALTSIFDFDSARTSPSFDKFWRDVHALLKDTGS